jgi:hypothetical protein
MNEKPDSSAAAAAAAAAAADAQALAQPSELVTSSISEFAEGVGVDPQQLLAGARFECNGMGMWLRHYGQKDPDGIVLVIDMGEYPEGEREQFLQFALEHNLLTPAALHGYYALVPGADNLAYCVRLDLATARNGPAALVTLIATLVKAVERLQKTINAALDAGSKDDAGASKVFG